MNRLSDYVVAAAAVYEACHVQPGEKVTIYSDTGRETEVVDAFIAAAQLRGADTTTLRVPARKPLEEPPTPAVEAMKKIRPFRKRLVRPLPQMVLTGAESQTEVCATQSFFDYQRGRENSFFVARPSHDLNANRQPFT